MQLFQAQVSEPENCFQSPSESALAEESWVLPSFRGPCKEDRRTGSKQTVHHPAVSGTTTRKLQTFIAQYRYDPCDGPSEQPELELPLTAGQYVFGQVDEDAWSVGELADSTRGFIPSNFAEEDLDDNLENETWNDPPYYIFSLSPILEEDEEDLDVALGSKKHRSSRL